MQQDIREALKDYKEDNVALTNNHSNKFEDLLMQEMHPKESKRNNYKWLSIAASVILLITIGIKFYPETKIDHPVKEISLGSISPEFNTIETYYTNSINLVMDDLQVTNENEEILEGYLSKIRELSLEYKSLTKELNTNGVNDNTIDALIRNLQLRLQLLQRLKKQLKQLKDLNTHKNENTII
jgi:hypothetical protein